MNMFIVNRKILYGAVALFFVLSLFGCAAPKKGAPRDPALSDIPKICPPHLQKLCRAYEIVQREYIQKLSDEELTEMFIRGFMKELNETQNDPYSKYILGKNQDAETKNGVEYAGIGMDMKKDPEPPYTIKVQKVFRGTPAYAAGIRRGDRITHINGISVADKTGLESKNLIRGKRETPIRLTLSRPCEGKPFTVSIKRRNAEDTVSGMTKMLAPHYAYIYIDAFDVERGIVRRVRYSLQKIQKTYGKLRGLIIDLRNNSGGNVLHARDFVSLFVEKGVVLYEKTQNGKEYSWNIPENKHDILPNTPIVILVNEDSASASEIVAGAMQDSGRAVIAGTKTYGKGVMQTPYNLTDESELYLTMAYTFTPRHTAIHKAGITPDIFVKEGNNESCSGDRQLAAALTALRKKNAQKPHFS